MVDLSSYQRKISASVYEIHNQLQMFQDIVNTRTQSCISIFFNKYDLFDRYLQHTPLRVAFPQYLGPGIHLHQHLLTIYR